MIQNPRNDDPDSPPRREPRAVPTPRNADAAEIAEQGWSRRSKGSTKPIPIPHFPPPRG